MSSGVRRSTLRSVLAAHPDRWSPAVVAAVSRIPVRRQERDWYEVLDEAERLLKPMLVRLGHPPPEGAKAKKLPLDYERHLQRVAKGARKAGARRSANTRTRTLNEVRATVHDACLQLDWYAKRNGRDDFNVLAGILRRVKGALSIAPWEPTELHRYVARLEECIVGARGASSERCAPTMFVDINREGLRELQVAVAKREAAGTVGAARAPLESEAGVIDFATVQARKRRRDEAIAEKMK